MGNPAVIDLNAIVNKVNNTKPKLIFGLFAFLQGKPLKIGKTAPARIALQINQKRQQSKQKATTIVYSKTPTITVSNLLK